MSLNINQKLILKGIVQNNALERGYFSGQLSTKARLGLIRMLGETMGHPLKTISIDAKTGIRELDVDEKYLHVTGEVGKFLRSLA